MPRPHDSAQHEEDEPSLLILSMGQIFLKNELRSITVDHWSRELENKSLENGLVEIIVPTVEKQEYETDSTVTDIYTFARRAYKLAWKAMVVVDPLSVRQISGNARIGETKEPTAIVVNLRNAVEESSPTTYYIRRLESRDALEEAYNAEPRDFSILATANQANGRFETNALAEQLKKGYYLRNPHASIFQDEDVAEITATAVEQVLSMKPSLPEEVKDRIQDFINVESPLEELSEAPATLEWGSQRLHVISLLRLTPQQLEEAKVLIKEAGVSSEWDGEVTIYNWKSILPATRRDVSRLYHRHLENNTRPRYAICVFLTEMPTSNKQNLTWATWYYSFPTLFQRGSVGECLKRWTLRHTKMTITEVRKQVEEDYQQPEGGNVERLLNPAGAFPPNMPRFMPARQVAELDISPPVFYLTKHLTEDENQVILDELYALADLDQDFRDKKLYCIVPWTDEEDGGPLEMWELLKTAINFQGGRNKSPRQAIFIDRQSPIDRTVLLADHCWNDTYDGFKGMDYGRVPGREATSWWVNLEIANLNIDECVQEAYFYRDPEYRK
ncbi:MAG: hypothetical protein M1820_010626 [Bogoriella megaspora]|nr:MAG: hypothetical protein M1820_010626 [Bogoriella megaspora]